MENKHVSDLPRISLAELKDAKTIICDELRDEGVHFYFYTFVHLYNFAVLTHKINTGITFQDKNQAS